MKETILRAFDVIIEDRLEKFAFEKLNELPDYQKVDTEIKALGERFITSLTEESQRDLLDQLEGLTHTREGMYLEFAYRQGLEDSFALHKELGALGIATQYRGGN